MALLVVPAWTYTIPPVRFEYLSPRGFRASIPDVPGLQMFAFHARINKPFERFEEGDYAEDIMSPSMEQPDQWVFDTTKPLLTPGSIIYYWVDGTEHHHYLHHYLNHNDNDDDPKPTTTTPAAPPCGQTVTTVNGGQPSCAGALIFEDTFDQNSLGTKWQHEIRIPLDTESAEFLSYQDHPENSYIAGGRLFIVPTLVTMSPDYTDERIRTGELTLQGCISPTNNPYECQRKAERATVLPPVMSAKLGTKNYFRFRYGRVEIRAKLPKGDWIFPQLLLQPVENYYGYADLASGQMRIAHILANRILERVSDGKQIDGHRLQGGVLITNQATLRGELLRSNSADEHFGDAFHVYGLIWTPDQIAVTVDGFQYGTIKTNLRQFAHQRNLTQANLWNAERPLAPFDREFFLSLGVGVGGVKDFPDPSVTGPSRVAKPWRNTSPKAEYLFYQNRNTWYRTWTEPELTVDYCLAECSLNVTRILMNKQFRVEQARKVLLARVDNDRNWTAIIERAVQNCYKQQICIAECVLGDSLVDGKFQVNASIALLTKQTGDDSLLTRQITSAIHKCYTLTYLALVRQRGPKSFPKSFNPFPLRTGKNNTLKGQMPGFSS
ncbi:Gram negative binding protein subgroup A [Anopheles darlingi]|uniref:Gram negative binding protein subgroup A n=1 Tax=Anopheles darlingi TaxID=43151 RepID=W5JN20_ANODA|nr:Gram negative binding protein subgroup A [Anopheles darlingi]